jgi:hypothetical protein
MIYPHHTIGNFGGCFSAVVIWVSAPADGLPLIFVDDHVAFLEWMLYHHGFDCFNPPLRRHLLFSQAWQFTWLL